MDGQAQKLLKRMRAAQITRYAIASESGLEWETVDSAVHGKRRTRQATLNKIADAIDALAGRPDRQEKDS
jgi:predicted DNA-binding transcriptional regulator YafY